MTSRIDDPDFFRRYIMNRMEQENASYDEGEILFGVQDKATEKIPKDWDQKCHLSHWIK